MSPAQAVLRGHAVATVPIVVIIGATAIAFLRWIAPPSNNDEAMLIHLLRMTRLGAGGIVGAAIGWLWWSFAIPRWRAWVRESGVNEESTLRLAVRTLLIWPKGSIFERTEFRPPHKSAPSDH